MTPLSRAEHLWSRLRRGVVLIVGFGERTGRAAAELFERQGIAYRISDEQPRARLDPLLAGLAVAERDIHCGVQEPTQLDGITDVLLSPGVPRTIPLVREAARRGIPVQVDIDLVFELMADKGVVAITGTDGKTTTTTLTGALLEAVGPVVVAGNIGVSPLAKVDEIASCRFVVLEVSSFMAEELLRFRPTITAILNIAEDHIDRYRTTAEYAAAKYGLIRNCRPSDVLVLNVDDPTLACFAPDHVTVRTTSRRDRTADSFFDGERFHLGGFDFLYAECRLAGQANIDNILAATTIAHEVGVPPRAIVERTKTFVGLRHRLEKLGTFGGVEIYEDSKASNVHAVEGALRNFERNVVLILGGRDKGLDFTILRPHLRRLRCLVCYGESGEVIREALGFEETLYRYEFADAVRLAASRCLPGDVLLLSPGCTSWDQFPNYEVRGDAFRELAPRLFA